MAAVLSTSIGKITYSDDFIAKVSGLCAMECYGIVGMANSNAADGIVSLLKLENFKKGVKVFTDDSDNINVRLHVIVLYGVSISEVARNIITTVKYGIEKSTGLNVRNVDVVVQGIKI